jgi:hypothetical protein
MNPKYAVDEDEERAQVELSLPDPEPDGSDEILRAHGRRLYGVDWASEKDKPVKHEQSE